MIEGVNNNERRAILAISPDEALNGTRRLLTLEGGWQVFVAVPAGAYSGQELRFPIQGSVTAYNPRGADLVLMIDVHDPYPWPSMQATTSTHINTQATYTPPQQPALYQPGAPTPHPSPAPTSRSSVIKVMLIILTILFVCGSILICYTGVYIPYRQQVQAAATAVAKVTSTANAYATSTAQTQATASAGVTATAQVVSAMQSKYDQITQRTPKLSDPLTGPGANNWTTADGCSFVNNAYHAVEDKKGFFLTCMGRTNNFADFAFQVKMTILRGDFGGLLLRSDTNVSTFYFFHINPSGSYDFYYYPDHAAPQRLLTGTTSLIQAGLNQENMIAVIAQGNDLHIYINGKYLDSANYNGSSTGIIGVVAEDATSATEVEYSQAQVWVL